MYKKLIYQYLEEKKVLFKTNIKHNYNSIIVAQIRLKIII